MNEEKYIQLLEDGELFGYIEQLEEEKKDLFEESCMWNEIATDLFELRINLQQRIDKAIEWINKNTVYFLELHKVGNYFINCKSDELLEILKGDVSNE